MLAALKTKEVLRVFTDVFGNCQFVLKEMWCKMCIKIWKFCNKSNIYEIKSKSFAL